MLEDFSSLSALTNNGLATSANQPMAGLTANDPLGTQDRNVLIFVADGLRPGSINPTDAPTISQLQDEGVSFGNSHSLFPTFTTPNASAIATGHYLGDTGDFSNTIYAGYPVSVANGNPIPFIENDPILGDLSVNYAGNFGFDASDPDSFSYYNFLNEETLLQAARLNGYNTAAVGKLGPTLIQDVSQGTPDPSTGEVPVPQTLILDDSTGKTGGIPLGDDIQQRLIREGLPITASDRSNGAPATSQLNNGFSGNNTTAGTLEANYVQQQYFTDAVTKAILPEFAQDPENDPFAMVYWSRDPDGTQHNQGDSLNSLTPGINGPTAKAAVQNADRQLAQIIAGLKADGLYDNTDIFITSDHGFSTISKSVVDDRGTLMNDYASTLTYDGVNPGFLPPGFVAIDLAHGLGDNLFDPDIATQNADGTYSYQAVDPTKGERPTFGNGLITSSATLSTPNATTAPPANVIVAANGGSDLVYIPDHNAATLQEVVDILSKENYVSGLFVNDTYGSIAGTLPLSAINLKGDAQTPTPAIVINFKSFSTDSSNPYQSQVEIADSTLQQGQGMHGSFGRGDTFNTMLAIGPDFKQGYVDEAPVSNADIAPTLAKILDLNIPTNNGDLVGRSIDEALVDGPDTVDFSKGVQKSDADENGNISYLNYQQVGDTKYFDAAGYAGGTVGLNTEVMTAGPQPDGTAINSHGWRLTPAGEQYQLGDRPYGMALSPDGKTLLVSNDGQSLQSLMVIDRATGLVQQTISYEEPEALYIGVAFSPDGKYAYASAGGNNKIRVYEVAGDGLTRKHLTEVDPIEFPEQTDSNGDPINFFPGGLAVSADGQTLYVADNLADSVSAIDLASREVTSTIPVGHNPYTVVLSADGKQVYVSNWGEDTISVIDTATNQVEETITVGTHPNAMILNPKRDELYIANADSNTVSVIDTDNNEVLRTIDLRPYPGAKVGSSPNALTVSPDGKMLYVANATNNDVAVIQLADDDTAKDEVEGLIPTGWYPAAIEISQDGKTLYVANAKGLGAGPNPAGSNPYVDDTSPDQYVGSMMTGTLSVIDVPDAEQLQAYTQQVFQNDRFDRRDKTDYDGADRQNAVPLTEDAPASPIKHVIYVIKENRTYDQVLGDLGQGNGDPSLTLFGSEVTPNQHELAKQFVTLDNLYADAEVSADGWNWSTAALANTYVQKNWPQDYSDRNRPYDFEGGNLATAPNEDPQNAYIWDELLNKGIDFRNYGFWVDAGKVADTEPGLATHTDLNYAGYDLSISDQTRIEEWLKEFQQYEADGKLPTVEFVRLPSDHTAGTSPGFPTPAAMVADNDLALGRLVDAVSHSPFWKDTAIFVIEDDAQDGPDHVDAHRTISQVISPYTQTGKVDSTFYSTTSLLKTMESILGIPPLTQYDSLATPMTNSFTDRPDFTPYAAIEPIQSLTEINTDNSPMAAESKAMNLLAKEDQAPEQELNEAIWKSVKGSNSEMPTPFTQFQEDDDKLVGSKDTDSDDSDNGSEMNGNKKS